MTNWLTFRAASRFVGPTWSIKLSIIARLANNEFELPTNSRSDLRPIRGIDFEDFVKNCAWMLASDRSRMVIVEKILNSRILEFILLDRKTFSFSLLLLILVFCC